MSTSNCLVCQTPLARGRLCSYCQTHQPVLVRRMASAPITLGLTALLLGYALLHRVHADQQRVAIAPTVSAAVSAPPARPSATPSPAAPPDAPARPVTAAGAGAAPAPGHNPMNPASGAASPGAGNPPRPVQASAGSPAGAATAGDPQPNGGAPGGAPQAGTPNAGPAGAGGAGPAAAGTAGAAPGAGAATAAISPTGSAPATAAQPNAARAGVETDEAVKMISQAESDIAQFKEKKARHVPITPREATALQAALRGKLTSALAHGDRAVALQPTNAVAWRARVRALYMLERKPAASAVLGKALALFPQDPELQKLQKLIAP